MKNLIKGDISIDCRWQETNMRFIGVFDIVGFKNWFDREGHNNVLEKLRCFQMIKELNYGINSLEIIKESTRLQAPKIIIFSDTIILISSSDSLEDSKLMILSTMELFLNCYALSIPIKGALSYGLVTYDNNIPIILGKPFIDAYLMQERLQVFSAVLDKKIENKFFEYEQLNGYLEFVNYHVPFKDKTEEYYLLNWCGKNQTDAFDSIILKKFEYECRLKGVIINNTKQFVNFCCEISDTIN